MPDGEDANGNGVIGTGETNPPDADLDDDGLSDAEDANGNGVVDAGETDPLNRHRSDGLQDGTVPVSPPRLPVGAVRAVHRLPAIPVPTRATLVPGQRGSTTDPLNPDTDAGGVCDGSLTVTGVCVAGKTFNNNGALDSGETDLNIGSNDPLTAMAMA
ncbi:MAG: hypothetical protein R3E95_18645 [Thiolinea sp.]